MEAPLLSFSTLDAAQKSILKIAGALLFLQLLFPPKVWRFDGPFGAQNVALGHVFILNDPMAQNNQWVSSAAESGFDFGTRAGTGIAWGTLILQFALTGGLAYAGWRFAQTKGLAR